MQSQLNSRLYPKPFAPNYYILTQLRHAYETNIVNYLQLRKDVLIDFGCGDMPYQPLFMPYVDNYVGIDFEGNPHAHVFLDTNQRVPLKDEYADVVLSSQVLEHVDDPDAYLQECARLLKPNGLLFLSTHGIWMYHAHPQDYWRWTGTGLKRLIEANNFAVINQQGIMGLSAIGVQLFQDGFIRRFRRPFASIGIRIMQRFIALLDRRHTPEERLRNACVFIIVAQKI